MKLLVQGVSFLCQPILASVHSVCKFVRRRCGTHISKRLRECNCDVGESETCVAVGRRFTRSYKMHMKSDLLTLKSVLLTLK